jgi:hypothetical protein
VVVILTTFHLLEISIDQEVYLLIHALASALVIKVVAFLREIVEPTCLSFASAHKYANVPGNVEQIA